MSQCAYGLPLFMHLQVMASLISSMIEALDKVLRESDDRILAEIKSVSDVVDEVFGAIAEQLTGEDGLRENVRKLAEAAKDLDQQA